MAGGSKLDTFLRVAEMDPRLGVGHICLYVCLYARGREGLPEEGISFTRKELMRSAKIAGTATYHKYMRELNHYGYIRYFPSCNPSVKSVVFLA